MGTARLTGHCNCGAIRFAIVGEPGVVGYCHCTRCQRRTGAAASAQVWLGEAELEFESGAELVRGWTHPDGGFEKRFCPVCGSQLFARDPDDHRSQAVRLGALDPGHGLTPSYRQFTAAAADWEPIPDDGLVRFPESRAAGLAADAAAD